MPYQPSDFPQQDRRSGAPSAGGFAPKPTAPQPAEQPAATAWSRVVRVGAPRPGPAALRARWLGVPLVPLLVAALVVGGVTAIGGGENSDALATGRPGDESLTGPSPVVTDHQHLPVPREPGAAAPAESAAPTGSATIPTADTPTEPAAPTDAPETDTPTDARTAPSRPPAPPATATTRTPRPTRTPAPGLAGERPVSFEALRVGQCFDIDRAAPGTALRRACDTPHQAEMVARPRLTGEYPDDRTIQAAATALCRVPLREKAAQQPAGTHWTTFVQFPYRTSYLLGADTVACSLVAPAAEGGTLTGRLR
ncbi:hypothetical protein AB0G79_11330 [Streptomyces sp. NPDC020807]|uniref:hypothetical protein n=1 Tax=Streptomyces sp. NPDC020807 TaxID=3155119 RepID=UPI0033E87321